MGPKRRLCDRSGRKSLPFPNDRRELIERAGFI